MSQVYFHFTLGPVQSFVSQARRTRDFWAGSFILSWLSAVALKEVIEQCKNPDAILFPKPEPTFMKALSGGFEGQKNGPQQGSIPNRFKAIVDKDHFNPKDVEKAVTQAWEALAELVYERDFEQSNLKHKPNKKLWDRQIRGCWEISWSYSAVPENIDETTREVPVLDQRKHWRSYAAPTEPGVKCMMMEGWQELSGVERPIEKSLTAFWKPLRESQRKMKTDIREKEYLCAIAFVKRRFPRHFAALQNVDMPAGWQANGWTVDEGRPSVSYMAAANWWAKTLTQANESALVKACVKAFYDAASKTGSHGEWESAIQCIDEATSEKSWRSLDGDLFFESVLENPRLYETADELANAQTTLKALRALNQETIQLGAATPFYAVLMMDGDNLGIQMQAVAKQDDIAKSLQSFTKQVPKIVYEHNGFLVYAGGDDVLAVLPMENAMACALAVRECYEASFRPYKAAITTSISAAIEYAHIRMPLMTVLKDAHQLLDEVAKDKTGRNAIAVRVWKPGGMALEWAQPWEVACEGEGDKKHLVLDHLATAFAEYQVEHDPQGQFSNQFFYKIRERLALFNPPKDDLDSPSVLLAEGMDSAVELMAAEYLSSGLCDQIENNAERLKYSKDKVKPLIHQCCSVNGHYQADAALLLRFLAQKGVMS